MSLSRYMAGAFLRNAVLIFVAAYALMLMVDVMELTRRGGDLDVPFEIVVAISALRLPTLAEQLLPFAVLIAALMTLVSLSRRSELVVARASGISAWQFLLPLLVAATALGVVATLLYNPLAAGAKQRSDALLAERFGGEAAIVDPEGEIWFRQAMDSGPAAGTSAIIRAASALEGGRRLNNVTALTFDATDTFVERVDAPSAVLSNGAWRMQNVTVTDPEGVARQVAEFSLPTPLTADDVVGRFTPPNHMPIWALPQLESQARLAGLASDRYSFQFQALLARPMLLMAMVLVAATVSLRFSRHGGTTPLVVAGLSAGFIVFIVNEIAGDLGSAGLVAPALAAWVPPVAAALVGVTALLHLEDG
ncbi:MAG: LPS export ABC transporter permease LptG [Devosiaceae bacterium]|nr:LPS export ABC transporter permease LptG [Devosiaceae bacterium MH13]